MASSPKAEHVNSTQDILRIQSLRVCLDGTPIVHDVSFSVGHKEVFAILGPSGCGKTTTLRAVAGLERDVSGSIHYKGSNLEGVPPEARQMGYLFQEGALFPHLNVRKNIGFGLRGLGREQRQARVEELLDLVRLQGLGERGVHELSGACACTGFDVAG